ncbi:MAG: bifunctional pyr operon transcriptional regulator/uracil phosphoribosyltransferase PyrR [Gemmatimonadota bacterium]|nr:bifunctional pyr operon transcriptional regulator/uracil phosphoribosyltransferase PyrR [Gemmatimonadota bacterium]
MMKETEIRQAITDMADALIALNEGTDDLILMGVHRRGVQVATVIRERIEDEHGVRIPLGTLDITFYRDDLLTIGPKPVVGQTVLPETGIEGKRLAIIDDVIFTGRTARAGLNELMDWGRPSKVFLLVLIDRGGREIPLQPDFAGNVIEALEGCTVDVRVPELDGEWAVEMTSLGEETP